LALSCMVRELPELYLQEFRNRAINFLETQAPAGFSSPRHPSLSSDECKR
jgi:hypothetical protein